MKVILKEELDNLGNMGEIVNVANGYARNFLIPKGFAIEANVKNKRALEHEQRIIQEKARKLHVQATDFAGRLSDVRLDFTARAGEEEKLFGSITTKDIAEALNAKGFEVDRKKISLEEPIKRLGEYTVDVKVARDVVAKVGVVVTAESE